MQVSLQSDSLMHFAELVNNRLTLSVSMSFFPLNPGALFTQATVDTASLCFLPLAVQGVSI